MSQDFSSTFRSKQSEGDEHTDRVQKKELHTYKLEIAYEGTHYSGWQVQPNAISIQACLEEKLSLLLQQPVRVIGSGRTDAGVHALGQVAHIRTSQEIDTQRMLRSMNGVLPRDIRVLSVVEASSRFHAQRSAVAKEYHYTIVDGPVVLPFDRPYVWHVHGTIDRSILREAAQKFVGTHDFRAFANENTKGAAAKNSVRSIYAIRIQEAPFHKIRLEFYGNGFLYKMVRNITGMLVSIAKGKRPIEDIEKAFKCGDRKAVSQAAPPHGLTLVRVDYPEDTAL